MIPALILSLALIATAGFQATASQAPPSDIAMATRTFEAARIASDRDGGRMWGVSLYGPILLVDPGTRKVVANQADAQGYLVATGGVFTGLLPLDVSIANRSVQWGGFRWAMMVAPVPGDETARAELAIHELFHRAQPQIGLPDASPSNRHLDTLEGRYLMRLEWRALDVALSSEGAARRQAICDALVFRSRRQELFPGSAAEETALELNEGLAGYTGCALAFSDPVARARELIATAEGRPSYTRSFAYGSGPAYGVLLDRLDASWRKRLHERGDLALVLGRAANVEMPRDLSQSTVRLARRYGGAEVRASEETRDRARRERDARSRARFVDGPVLKIALERASISFDPNALEPLDDLGTVYPTMEVVDEWGRLSVTGGALLASDWSRLSLPAGSIEASSQTIRGDGWILELGPGWRLAAGDRADDAALVRLP